MLGLESFISSPHAATQRTSRTLRGSGFGVPTTERHADLSEWVRTSGNPTPGEV